MIIKFFFIFNIRYKGTCTIQTDEINARSYCLEIVNPNTSERN